MADKIDGVKLALLSNRLEGISRKMGNTLMRTGRSGVLNIARDFSCCILTADDQLAAVADGMGWSLTTPLCLAQEAHRLEALQVVTPSSTTRPITAVPTRPITQSWCR